MRRPAIIEVPGTTLLLSVARRTGTSLDRLVAWRAVWWSDIWMDSLGRE